MKYQDALSQLASAAFGRQKILAGIYRDFGSQSLFDYANGWQIHQAKNLKAEQEIFFRHFAGLFQKIYGASDAAEATAQFKRLPLVSTIDHHGILNHPFFINSNLIFSLRQNLPYLVCLSTAGVSLNNSSWPGCLLWSGKDGQMKRVSFFPDSQKTQAVLAAGPLAQKHIDKVLTAIQRDHGLEERQKQRICEAMEKIARSAEVLSQPSFARQAGIISARLWQEIFPRAPQVFYLPMEDLVSEIIQKEISQKPEHVLHRLLFTSRGWDLVEKYFQGSLGAFSSAHKGSFLFWGVNRQGRRVHLHRQGAAISDGAQANVQLSAEAVAEALGRRQIYPTSLVCFLALLYYHVTCLGGFNQVNWLTAIKEKFLALLKEMSQDDLAREIAEIRTNNFAEGNLAFLWQQGRLIKATGMDILLAEDHQLFINYQELSKQLTIAESIESLLPEIYRIVVPAGQRQENLLALTDEQIAEQNGLERKIRSVMPN